MAEDWIEQRHRLAVVASEATARADRYERELRMARLIIAEQRAHIAALSRILGEQGPGPVRA